MIRFLVDSASDLTAAECEQAGVELICMQVSLDGNSYLDGKDISKDEFYSMLTSTKDFPKTSQPTPAHFMEVFEKVKEAGDELVCILLSSTLSGTYQSALIAKNTIDYDGIYLVDSLSAACGIRMMLKHGMALRERGLGAFEITRELTELRERVHIFVFVDTLEYLYRGGRLSKASAAIGELANIKPVLTLSREGSIEVVGKYLGKTKAFAAMIQRIAKLAPDGDFPIYALYSTGTENLDALTGKLEQSGITVTERLQIGATLGTHVGPELAAIAIIAGKQGE